jgi:hypothetical protein
MVWWCGVVFTDNNTKLFILGCYMKVEDLKKARYAQDGILAGSLGSRLPGNHLNSQEILANLNDCS